MEHIFTFIAPNKEVIFGTSALTFDERHIWRNTHETFNG